MQTQPVTPSDIAGGKVRIPIEAKVMFPKEPTMLELVFRGRSLSCKWNPQVGPDKERSGVLQIGKAVLEEMVKPGKVLKVTATETGLRID